MNTLKHFAASLLITLAFALPVLADDGHIEIPGITKPPTGSTTQSATLSVTLELIEMELSILS